METIEVNIDYFKKCLKVISKDPARWSITGVYIHDDSDGFRHYVGTNGHILVHCKEKTADKPLEKGLIIKPLCPLGTKRCLPYCPLKIVDENTAILETNKKICCDIVDAEYPSYERVMPKDPKPEMNYVCFSPKYLQLMENILGCCYIRPLADGVNEPHIFRCNDDVEVVIMPMRI